MTLFKKQYRAETTRLAGWDYGSRGWYFTTLCTKDRECLLGTTVNGKIELSRAGLIAQDKMQQLSEHYSNVSVDRSVIMPNHVHAIIVIEGRHQYSPSRQVDGAGPVSTLPLCKLGDVIGGFKASVSRACRAEGIASFAWQERFHDRVLGSNASVNAVRDYIDHNPENWMEDPDNSTSPICMPQRTLVKSS
jgi:putative transposase